MKTTHQQVAALLEALTGFYDVPRSGLELAATLEANAQRARLEAESRFGVSLSRDENGIKALSELLSAMHAAVKPGRLATLIGRTISFHSSVLIANTFGAFLGETLRERIGGQWKLIDFQDKRLVALWFDDQNWSLPTYKAGKHFMNGKEDDVLFFYQTMVEKHPHPA